MTTRGDDAARPRAALRLAPAPADRMRRDRCVRRGEKVRGILSRAGFDATTCNDSTRRLYWRDATFRRRASVRVGPVSALSARWVSSTYPSFSMPSNTLAPLAAPDGHVSLNGSTWIVSATKPA